MRFIILASLLTILCHKAVKRLFIIIYLSLIISRALSRRKWSPATTGPAGPSMADLVAIDGPAGPSMAAMDGPPCRKWSPIYFAANA